MHLATERRTPQIRRIIKFWRYCCVWRVISYLWWLGRYPPSESWLWHPGSRGNALRAAGTDSLGSIQRMLQPLLHYYQKDTVISAAGVRIQDRNGRLQLPHWCQQGTGIRPQQTNSTDWRLGTTSGGDNGGSTDGVSDGAGCYYWCCYCCCYCCCSNYWGCWCCGRTFHFCIENDDCLLQTLQWTLPQKWPASARPSCLRRVPSPSGQLARRSCKGSRPRTCLSLLHGACLTV